MPSSVLSIRDLKGNENPLQATHEFSEELNGNHSLSATILPTIVNDQFIKDIDKMWTIIDENDTDYKIVYCKRQGVGSKLSVSIKAIPKFFDDFDTQRIYERYDRHMTAQEFFTIVFGGSGYNFILVDTFYAQDWEGLGDSETRLSAFKRGLERYKAEFRISGNTVYLERQVGRDTQFQYRYRLNASNIVQEIDGAAFYTYARGYGDYEDGGDEDAENNAGLIDEYTSPLADIPGIGKRDAPPVKNGNIKDPDFMREQLKILVDESLKISVSADIHDLRNQGYALAQPEKGDRVFLIDERIGLNEEVRVVDLKTIRNWKGDIIDLKLIFGSEGITKRHQSNLNAAAKQITELLEGRRKLPFSVLPSSKQNAVRNLEAAMTELIFGNGQNGVQGIIAQDKNDPNKMMWLNSAGFMISTDGGATPVVAATADGFVADVITTGTLNADQVAIYGGHEGEYAYISGSTVELRGTYERSWRGETSTHDVRTRLHNGHLRFRNDDLNRSLYLSEYGISTYLDGEGEGQGSSGTIVWWDPTYSPTGANGITINSYGGVVALESDTNRIVLNASQSVNLDSKDAPVFVHPRNNLSSYDQAFGFTTGNDNEDGYLMYGATDDYHVGFRMFYGGDRNLIAVVDGDHVRGGNTWFDVGNIATNRIDKRDGSATVYWNGSSGGTTSGTDPTITLFASGLRANIGSNDIFLATNSGGYVRVTNYAGYNDGNGITYMGIAAAEFVTVSSVYYKKNIEYYTKDAMEMINGTPVRFFHMNEDIEGIDPKRVGLIVQESPVDIVTIKGGDSINLYAMASILWKGSQELSEKINEILNFKTSIQTRVDELERELKSVKLRVEELENAA
ncbi:phage tail protein [Sediminibacillus massiliensis]|uniref:phage tail protein n=1 Tax=Sediminibacillus massiliensis TaxID=1926277 RepID=UPI0015C30CCB|nr:phage tail protein [Sediminibacillus massiliensis]